MNNIKADLLIIGAGSGGLVLASGAAQLGANVVLVEGDKMGCLLYTSPSPRDRTRSRMPSSA